MIGSADGANAPSNKVKVTPVRFVNVGMSDIGGGSPRPSSRHAYCSSEYREKMAGQNGSSCADNQNTSKLI